MAQTFRIVQIIAHCDNPIRNSIDELIFGEHILWYPAQTRDGDIGSLAPNVFSYDFSSDLNSTIKVAIELAGDKPSEGKYRLHGLVDSHKVFTSDLFAFKSNETTFVAAKIIDPHRNSDPFSWNADVSWELEQKDVTHKIESPEKTRLELYWISPNIHEIFLAGKAGIPINLLRGAIPSLAPNTSRGMLTHSISTPTEIVHSASGKHPGPDSMGYSAGFWSLLQEIQHV